MKLSLKWLNNYIDVKEYFDKPEILSGFLTHAGLEVESIQNQAKAFDNVVVGCVLEKGKHPNSDKLSLCQVSTGSGVVQQIVCGAQNHKEGDRVVVALIGATLPNGMHIQKTTIRSIDSYGMLCSEKELGLKAESSGLLILPSDAPIGESFAKYFGMDDIFFELKVTPNRADCLSHFGLARELSCLLNIPAKLPSEKFTAAAQGSTKKTIALEVKQSKLCPRYAGRVIHGLKVGESPLWLKKSLEAVGMNSINNVVDATNFVMMELGQPLHAFDTRNLKGAKIIVDLARPKEKFISFDGTEYELDGTELCIRDNERPVCLAGIVGTADSGVVADTTEIFLECAYFNPQTVRKTARRLGIETDSAYRYQRGVDPDGVARALDRAAYMIQSVAGGEVYSDHHDFYPEPVKAKEISLNLFFVEQKLGMPVTEAKFIDWMKRLSCQVSGTQSDMKVTPPLYRFDLQIAEDLMEEYARLEGYDKIPETMPALQTSPTHNVKNYDLTFLTRKILIQEGYQEALNYAFLNLKKERAFLGDEVALEEAGLPVTSDPIKILNPLGEDVEYMRSTLLYSLLENVDHNTRRGGDYGRLFEVGYVFRGKQGQYSQAGRLALASWGKKENLWKAGTSPLVLEVKAQMENLFRDLFVTNYKWVSLKRVPSFLHAGQAIALQIDGKNVGYLGRLHPEVQEERKIRSEVVLAELDLEAILRAYTRAYRVKPLSRFPVVERDFAFVCAKVVQAGDVLASVRAAAGPLLVDLNIFDAFEGGSLSVGQKSLGVRMWFQDKNQTLSEEQINEIQAKVLETVKEKYGAALR